MAHRINCFTLSSSCIEEGVAVSLTSSGNPEVRIGSSPIVSVRFGDEHWDNVPVYTATRVLQARAVMIGRYHRLVRPPEGNKTVLLRIIVRNLDFRAEPFVDGLNINPGGEGPKAFVQSGHHRDDVSKDQLFELANGEQMIAIDQKKAVMNITCRNGVPVIRPASKPEFAVHVLAYGMRARGRREIAWATHTLRRLGENARQLEERLRNKTS